MRQFFASVIEVFEIALVAVGAVFLIRSFLIQPFLVSGSSMVPAFADGNYLLIDELTYHFREPSRGEVVVFRSPGNSSVFFIKRIVGLPGEEVSFKDGKVWIVNAGNPAGFALKESYLPPSTATRGDSAFKLAEDEYLLLGDNRSYSFDSRSWGPLEREAIVGIARLRLWPFGEFTAFAAPTY